MRALYPSAVELVATGQIYDTLTVGPFSPQLVAGITAHAAGLDENAREHFAAARREARETPYRILQPAIDYWQGRMLVEDAGGSDRSSGLAMLEAALTDFRDLDMVLHATLADRLLRQ